MREVVSPLSGIRSPFGQLSSLLAIYAVLGIKPELVFDFANGKFFTMSSRTTFANAITHSRTTNATMVDSDGLLKWAPHNLLTYSEQFDNASWTKVNCTISVNATTAPDGSLTADEVIPDTTSLTLIKPYNIAGTYTANVWVKDAGRGVCSVAMGSNTIGYLINVDLTDGSYISGRSYGGGVLVGYTIADAGNGWYFVSVTATANLGGVSVNGGDGVSSSSGIYIWGAHLYRYDLGGMVNNPDRGDSYVPTTSSARYLPRRGHHVYNGTAWVNEGVLHESEARTNLLTYSEDLSNAIWVARSFTKVGTTTGPLGTTAYEFLEDGTSANPAIYYTGNVTDGTPRTFGVWLKASTPVTIALSTNANVKTTDVLVTTDWQFFHCTDSVNTSLGPHIGGFNTITQGSGIALYVAMPQQEAGSTPSSYIPTAGAAVTRAAETLTIPAANLPWPTVNVIGPELVTNGGFDTASDWTLGGTWSISSGVASAGGTAGSLTQAVSLSGTSLYEVTYTVTSVTSGNVRVQFQGGSAVVGTLRSSPGTYTQLLIGGTGNTTIAFVAGGTAPDAAIDNISVREIDPLAVSIQMQGRATGDTYTTTRWYLDANNYITQEINSSDFTFEQAASGTVDAVTGGSFTSGVNTPFNFASTHASTLVAAAVGGTALTDNTTPVALPNLSATNLNLGHSFMGTLKLMRVWSANITEAGREEASA